MFLENLQKKILNKEHILIIPAKFDEEYIKRVYGDLSAFTISNDAHKELKEAEFGFICSGTATLEAAIVGTPFVMSYVAKKFDYFLGRMFVKLPYIGLANIFFHKMGKEPIHKEFFQEEVNVQNLFLEYENLNREGYLKNSQTLREYLKFGSSENVAKIIKN